MRDVFITADNIVSPIGATTADNFEQMSSLMSGIKSHDQASMSKEFFFASLFEENANFLQQYKNSDYTKFEQLLIASITDALRNCSVDPKNKNTVLIISSTKGNISLLETEVYSEELRQRISLNTSAKIVAEHFHFANKPIVISNACISGLLAMITGMRMIQSGQYDHAVIAGADVVSKFVLSGFQSFQAVSKELCKPFDAARTGINLGEAAGTVILSADKRLSNGIKIYGGAVSNDANHISGPSRTGEELKFAIDKAMNDAGLNADDIDFISAHGTATIYNDEMEANAITLANMQHIPVNSLKGYFGHTLGAAGIIEAIISMQSLQKNKILPTLGFENIGVSKPINVSASFYNKEMQNCLKTASGFGGCNAAIIIGKQ